MDLKVGLNATTRSKVCEGVWDSTPLVLSFRLVIVLTEIPRNTVEG